MDERIDEEPTEVEELFPEREYLVEDAYDLGHKKRRKTTRFRGEFVYSYPSYGNEVAVFRAPERGAYIHSSGLNTFFLISPRLSSQLSNQIINRHLIDTFAKQTFKNPVTGEVRPRLPIEISNLIANKYDGGSRKRKRKQTKKTRRKNSRKYKNKR